MIFADVAVMQPILSSGMFSTSPFFLQNEAKKPAEASESGGDTPTITTLLSLLIYYFWIGITQPGKYTTTTFYFSHFAILGWGNAIFPNRRFGKERLSDCRSEQGRRRWSSSLIIMFLYSSE